MARKENASYEGNKNRTAKLTAEDVGALPITGGRVAGNIEVKDYIRIKDAGNFYSAVCDFLTSTELRSVNNDGNYTALILFNADSTSGTCIKYRVKTSDSSKDYSLYGEHNYQDIKIGKVLKMHDGVNVRTVIQCLDDGDENNYGSEVIIGGDGNTYIGAGESPTNLHNALATSNEESLYISSDNSIFFYVNCNNIENRKCLTFTSSALFPYTSGNFTLGTSSAKWGQIYSTASSISTSDRNQKHDIKELPESQAHNLIFGLNPVIYKYNDGTSDRRHWGLIAQDVEELMESIHLDSSDFAGFIKSPREKLKDEKTGEFELDLDEDGNLQYDYALRYEEFIAPLIKVVQEQQKEIGDLEERIKKLERLCGGGSDGMADTKNELEMD